MAKQAGLGDNFYYSGYNISGDVNSISKLSTPLAVQDTTDITQSAISRLGLLRSAEVDWVSFFDPTNAHVPLSALPRTDQVATYFRGTAVGNPAFSCQGVQLNYDPTRGADGSLTASITEQSDAFGGEWGEQLTPGVRTDSAATNGATQQDAAGTNFGAQLYLHVFSFTGTSVDIVVQHAPDGSTWTTLFDFGAISAAPQVIRAAVNGSVQQYLRINTGAGTFSNVQFAAMLVRNPVAVAF